MSASVREGVLVSDYQACPPPFSSTKYQTEKGKNKSAKERKRSDDRTKLSSVPKDGADVEAGGPPVAGGSEAISSFLFFFS